jgi:hypothetical protein
VLKAMIVNRLRLVAGACVIALGMLGLGTAAVIGQPAPQNLPQEPFDLGGGANNPFAAGQPPSAAKKAAAPKVAAKGIEDEDVPYPSLPSQAVVRLEDGKLIVRQRTRGYLQQLRTTPGGGQAVVAEWRTTVSGRTYDASDLSVFDMKGNRVADREWKAKLERDVLVLVSFDGHLPHPRQLKVFREDTLVLVLPGMSQTPPTGPAPGPIYSAPPLPVRPRTGPGGEELLEPVPVPAVPTPVPGGTLPRN